MLQLTEIEREKANMKSIVLGVVIALGITAAQAQPVPVHKITVVKHIAKRHPIVVAQSGMSVAQARRKALPVVAASTTPTPEPAKGAQQISKAAATANPVTVLQTFTVADLTAALADANAQTPPDTTAATCYTALIPIVQTGVANPFPTGLGGFQLLQKGRDLKSMIANLQSQTGPLAAINTACAPLVLSLENTLIQLGIVGGGIAATSGLTLPIALPFLGL